MSQLERNAIDQPVSLAHKVNDSDGQPRKKREFFLRASRELSFLQHALCFRAEAGSHALSAITRTGTFQMALSLFARSSQNNRWTFPFFLALFSAIVCVKTTRYYPPLLNIRSRMDQLLIEGITRHSRGAKRAWIISHCSRSHRRLGVLEWDHLTKAAFHSTRSPICFVFRRNRAPQGFGGGL